MLTTVLLTTVGAFAAVVTIWLLLYFYYRRVDNESSFWQEHCLRMINCLRENDLEVISVSGEADNRLFRNIVKLEVIDLDKRLPENKKGKPKVVCGPVICLSDFDRSSILLDLFDLGLIDLYYSDKRQEHHFRVGLKKQEAFNEPLHDACLDGKGRKKLVEKTPKESLYYRGEENVKPLIDEFDEIVKDSSVVRKCQDPRKEFLLLTRREIHRLKKEMKKHDKNYNTCTKDQLLKIAGKANWLKVASNLHYVCDS